MDSWPIYILSIAIGFILGLNTCHEVEIINQKYLERCLILCKSNGELAIAWADGDCSCKNGAKFDKLTER